MTGQMKSSILLRFFLTAAIGLAVISCGPRAQQPLSRLDTPEHHTFTGMRLVNQGKIAEAGREFELALRLEPHYAKAHTGTALVRAYEGDFPGARRLVEQARKDAQDDEEDLFVSVGSIRVDLLSRAACLKSGGECMADGAWLESAREAFAKAVAIDPKAAEATYFMAECHLAALDLDAAGRMFSRVLDLGAERIAEADAGWKLVQKIQRAMPGTATGKRVALLERVTRADAAALFMEELQIDALYARRAMRGFDTAFKDPQKVRAGVAGPAAPTDIAGHPLRAEIEGVIRVGTRGLKVYPDGTFRPGTPVDRAGFAVMIEDILLRITGDGALATRFIGSPSPFPDLRPDLPCFNAVMVVTSRGIMEARDPGMGAFAPLQPITGVEALLVIRKLREEWRY
jgi:thioredoxin-like negative regulator of GroEL